MSKISCVFRTGAPLEFLLYKTAGDSAIKYTPHYFIQDGVELARFEFEEGASVEYLTRLFQEYFVYGSIYVDDEEVVRVRPLEELLIK